MPLPGIIFDTGPPNAYTGRTAWMVRVDVAMSPHGSGNPDLLMMTSDGYRLRGCLVWLLLWSMLPGPGTAWPQDLAADAEERPATSVSEERLDALRKQIEAATDLTDEQRQKGLEALRKAGASLTGLNELTALERQSAQRQATLDENRQLWEARSRELKPIEKSWLGDSLSSLEQTLAAKQSELVQAQADLDRVQTRISQRAERQRVHRERLTENPKELDEIRQQTERLAASTDPPLLVEAERLRLLAEQRRLEAEPRALQSELAAIVAQDAVNLLQLERQYHAERVARLREEVADWTQAVTRRRRLDAEDRAELSRSQAARAEVPLLREIYQTNLEIVEDELAVRLARQQAQAAIEAARVQRESLETQWEQLRSREDRLAASTAFGIRLRQQRQALDAVANPAALRREIRQRGMTYEETQLDYFDWKERRKELDRFEQLVERSLKSVSTLELPGDEDISEFEARIRSALEQQRSYLDLVLQAYEDYNNALSTLDYEQAELAELAREFRKYIDERVLWVPSHQPLRFQIVVGDTESVRSLVDPVAWGEILSYFLNDVRRSLWLYLLAGLAWGGLIGAQRRMRETIRRLGQKATSRLNTALRPTVEAGLWTVVKSVAYPFPLLFLGARVRFSVSPQHLASLAELMLLIGAGVFSLEFVRHVSRPYGLGAAHFGWPKRVNELISRQVSMFLTIAVPIALLAAVLHSRRSEGGSDALERILAIVISLLLAYVLHRLTSRRGGIVQEWIDTHRNGWMDRLSGLWHLMAIGIPVSLAVLTAAGYAYAAQRLSVMLIQSLLMIYGAVFLRSFLFRWLTLRQRRLAIEQAREIRAAMAARAEGEGDTSPPEAQEARSNLADVSTQAKRLLNTTIVILSLVGLWLIWTDLVPALHYFDAWQIPGFGVSIGAGMSAIVVVILTATAARNIPGLLEITLLEKLPLDRSVRYAVGALTQYAIVIVGLLTVSDILGIVWEKVQWLAAALTFGLGFGLQEIFANFVSGIIILFEQPVRVGDVVTIDGVTGSVTRIRIRSTTIMDWDRKEYIVPNREFITGRLLNWTLTDTLNRVTVKVGVSYGSDPDQVREIILNVIRTQEHVLSDPEPRVFFDGFGDSSLNFTAFAFLAALDQRLPTTHGLHSRIFKAFAEAGIEIPFPQRDLHVRSMVPIPGIPSTDSPVPNSSAELSAAE